MEQTLKKKTEYKKFKPLNQYDIDEENLEMLRKEPMKEEELLSYKMPFWKET